MAEAVFRARLGNRSADLHVSSAGVAAIVGRPPPQRVITVMADHGIDISKHRARQLDAELATDQDLILVMEESHQSFIEQKWMQLTGRVRLLGGWRKEEISDPFGREENVYVECLHRIEACVDDWKARLLT